MTSGMNGETYIDNVTGETLSFSRTPAADRYYKKMPNGKSVYHRVDGPAIYYRGSGNSYWVQNGQNHRIDGPAVNYVEGGQWWYINGVLLEVVAMRELLEALQNK
jgi:hypothetical protein